MSRFVYSGQRLREVRFPLGGIGAGCVSIDGGARLVDWEIKNRPNKDSYNGFSHIAVKAERGGEVLAARALHGPLQGGRMGFGLHSFGGYTYGPARETLAGVPHFSGVSLEGRFPIARYDFEGEFPGRASLTAWSPFEPVNDFDSSLPLALFEVALENTTGEALDYSVAFSLCNPEPRYPLNRLEGEAGLRGLVCDTGLEDRRSAAWGQACVFTDAAETSAQAHWYRGLWFDALNVFWQDFTAPGRLRPRVLEGYPQTGAGVAEPTDHGTLCAHLSAAPGQTVTARFALAWYYPNYEKYWGTEAENPIRPILRNWYAGRFTGAAAVARYGLAEWGRLYGAAKAFAGALYGSTLPEEVRDAAGATLAVLKSPTCVRLSDGSFYGWEGSHAREGSCEGSCQHVWNYQYALPLLFPALERSMRELDYRYNTRADGGMGFRLQLPLGSPPSPFRACADGQMGGVLKSYREWKLSGDTAWLKGLWPDIRRSLAYAWSADNLDKWDPGRTGVLTGRQHHTLDMELFGPNSWLTGLYLAALEAAARMAEALGEPDFAAECRAIRDKGRAWVNEHLFNGEYFFHKVDLGDKGILAAYAQNPGDPEDPVYRDYWNAEAGQLKYQIGEGSSIDQVYGQWHADLLGLGEVFAPEKVASALASIYKYNYMPSMADFFNPCRIYCMENEGGTLICAYPPGRERPVISAPYAEETMHGFEYAAACHMLLRGMEQEGLACVRAVRDRYDGATRNPWNEIECGGNYARSMAAWALVPACQGFSADMTEGRLGFAPLHEENHRSPWSAGGAWGQVAFESGTFTLKVLGGGLVLKSLALPNAGRAKTAALNGKAVGFAAKGGALVWDEALQLREGDVLGVVTVLTR